MTHISLSLYISSHDLNQKCANCHILLKKFSRRNYGLCLFTFFHSWSQFQQVLVKLTFPKLRTRNSYIIFSVLYYTSSSLLRKISLTNRISSASHFITMLSAVSVHFSSSLEESPPLYNPNLCRIPFSGLLPVRKCVIVLS